MVKSDTDISNELPCPLRLLVMRLPVGNKAYVFCEKIKPSGHNSPDVKISYKNGKVINWGREARGKIRIKN